MNCSQELPQSCQVRSKWFFTCIKPCATAANHPACDLAGFEEKDGNLTKVEIDEVLCFMCDVRTKVPTHNGMPRRVVLLVELLLDEGSNIFLDIVLLKGG